MPFCFYDPDLRRWSPSCSVPLEVLFFVSVFPAQSQATKTFTRVVQAWYPYLITNLRAHRGYLARRTRLVQDDSLGYATSRSNYLTDSWVSYRSRAR